MALAEYQEFGTFGCLALVEKVVFPFLGFLVLDIICFGEQSILSIPQKEVKRRIQDSKGSRAPTSAVQG